MDTRTLDLLKQTTSYFSGHNRQAYLVGGSLRNILLGEPCIDWDVVTDGDAAALARGLANRLGGYYVLMHEKASRVVVVGESLAGAKQETIIDVSPLMGGILEEDLRRRDFTVDAMAAPLGEVVGYFAGQSGEDLAGIPISQEGGPTTSAGHTAPHTTPAGGPKGPHPTRHHPRPYGYGDDFLRNVHLIDPFNGLRDIYERRLRAVDENVFRHDPLRMLRAVRLGMRYGLRIDAGTEGLIRRDARLLVQVAAQRIHDELYAIVEPEGAGERLRYLDELGLLTVLVPEFIAARGMRQPGPHFWDVFEHSLQTVAALERLAEVLQSETQAITEHQTGLASVRVDETGLEAGVVAPLAGARPEDETGLEAGVVAPLAGARPEDETGQDTDAVGPSSPAWGAGNERPSPMYRPGPANPYSDDFVHLHHPPATPSISHSQTEAGEPTINGDDLAQIRELLHEAEGQGVFHSADLRAPRMKLAALLHDIGKPLTYSVDEDGDVHFYNHQQAGVPLAQGIMTRLGASTHDRRFVELVVAHHMRPGQLARLDVVTPRAVRRYFVDLGPAGIVIALFSLADHMATLGPQEPGESWERHVALVRLLLTRYVRERESILPPRLVSPEELMRRLKLQPGPLIGHLLEEIAEAQAEGRVHSKEEALWLAEEKIRVW